MVVVESPTKARTISRYLDDEFVVKASMGHVRDLPDNKSQLPARYRKEKWAYLGVDVENGFRPVYVIKDGQPRKAMDEIRKALKEAEELLLATDEDREGEAISWHILEVLKPSVPYRRMVFHEITRQAIEEALNHTRDIDMALVEAQETRRILDRLVGYPLSMLVTRKIKNGLSAGRVQSVAVRLLVERERERRRFRKANYYSLKAILSVPGSQPGAPAGRDDLETGGDFEAALHTVDGLRLAGGKDFDENTGRLKDGADVVVLDEEEVKRLLASLRDERWVVEDVVESFSESSPKPPFITSTLQQEASRRLSMGAKETMAIAQRLYERGFITYMRTDSTFLSSQAIQAAREAVRARFGDSMLPPQPRIYKSRVRAAQEAHEAIRPAGETFVPPSETGLTGKELRLYELIWRRTLASQMANARHRKLRVDVKVEGGARVCVFRATASAVVFPGYLAVWQEDSQEGGERRQAASVDVLQRLGGGDVLRCDSLQEVEHETRPPARYTEASLIRTLEEYGIGRPSTYATIMDKLYADGRYARRVDRALVPTYVAFAVTQLLEEYFPELVDVEFTAHLEEELDRIARGETTKLGYLERFYSGAEGFSGKIERHGKEIDPKRVKIVRLDGFDGVLRVGRYGAYAEIEVDGEKKTVNVPDDIPPADLTVELLLERLREEPVLPLELGADPETGLPVRVMKGPYGYYLQRGDDKEEPGFKRCSLPKQEEPRTITLERALSLLELPRVLGRTDDGREVSVGIGRYGPYVKCGDAFASIPYETLFDEELDAASAAELFESAKKNRRKGPVELRSLGPHPSLGEEMKLMKGRYGPYVKCGAVNASLPAGESPESLTPERAASLVDEKMKQGGGKKKRRTRRRASSS